MYFPKIWVHGPWLQETDFHFQVTEGKVNHMTKIKIKLENTLGDLEDNVEREKKLR